MQAKLRELVQEFRTVFAGRSNLADSVIAPIVFLIANPLLGFGYAVWGSLLISLLVCLYRLAKRQSLKYALGGLGGVALAILAVRVFNREEAYHLPGVITGLLTAVIYGKGNSLQHEVSGCPSDRIQALDVNPSSGA